MAKQQPPLPPSLRFAIAAARFDRARGRKLSAKEWKAMYRGWLPPPEDELLFICHHLVANPHQIADGHFDWHIYNVLQDRLTSGPSLWRRQKSEKVADLVDILVDTGTPVAAARKQVAVSLKKSIEAVKQAHLRHGRKRDK